MHSKPNTGGADSVGTARFLFVDLFKIINRVISSS
jgi:hypothetical protein